MAYYQADVLEEEVITQWGTHVSKKYVDKDISKRVRKASEPMLKVSGYRHCKMVFLFTDHLVGWLLQWLEEADDDSEEE